MRAFVSHTHKDKPAVRSFATKLRLGGVDIWLDEWELSPGDSIPGKVGVALDTVDTVLVCWSERASTSEWVKSELETAIIRRLEDGLRIIPVCLDDTPLPALLRPLYWVSVTDDDDQTAVNKILGRYHRIPSRRPTAPGRGDHRGRVLSRSRRLRDLPQLRRPASQVRNSGVRPTTTAETTTPGCAALSAVGRRAARCSRVVQRDRRETGHHPPASERGLPSAGTPPTGRRQPTPVRAPRHVSLAAAPATHAPAAPPRAGRRTRDAGLLTRHQLGTLRQQWRPMRPPASSPPHRRCLRRHQTHTRRVHRGGADSPGRATRIEGGPLAPSPSPWGDGTPAPGPGPVRRPHRLIVRGLHPAPRTAGHRPMHCSARAPAEAPQHTARGAPLRRKARGGASLDSSRQARTPILLAPRSQRAGRGALYGTAHGTRRSAASHAPWSAPPATCMLIYG